MQGKTLAQARVAWDQNQDVLCPYCENHVDEEDAVEWMDEVYHLICQPQQEREDAMADEQASKYDSQEDLPSDSY